MTQVLEPATLPTPALLLDQDAFTANLATMAAALEGKAALRPHAKTHKCAEIAHRQLAAGAIGITVATVSEALSLAHAGIPELLVANEIVEPSAVTALAACSKLANVIVGVDDESNLMALAAAATRAGSELGVLIEVDVGMGRGGARSADETLRLAAACEGRAGVRLLGVMGYEGHVVLEPDPRRRAALATEAMELLASRVEALRAAGFTIDIVSAGGTNTFATTAAHPVVTEIQAGTYAVMDHGYRSYGPQFQPVLSVLGTVISRHGDRVVLDVGTKAMALTDLAGPVAPPGMRVVDVHEEHTLVDLVDRAADPRVGARLALGVAYCGGTVNLHEAYHVVSRGEVVDRWTIVAPGARRALVTDAD